MQLLPVALLFLAASVVVGADADAGEAPAAAETTPLDDEWAQLSSAALVHLTQQHDAVVVLFTAPWCGECPRWRRTFGQARGKVKDDGLNVRMLVLDGLDPKNQQVVAAHGVTRYPTTLAFTAGSQGLPYQGARELFALHSFVKDIAGPPVAINPRNCRVRGGGGSGGAAAAPHVMVGLFDSVDAAAKEVESSSSFAAFARAAASAPHHATLVRHVAFDRQNAAGFARCLEEAGEPAAEGPLPRVVYLRSFEPRLVEVLPPGGTLTVRAAHAAVERHAVPAVVQLVRDESGDSLHSALNNAFVSHPYVKVVYFPAAAAGASADEVDALRRAVRTSEEEEEEAEEGGDEGGGGSVPIRAAWAAPAFEEAAEFYAATGLSRPCLVVVAADGRRYGEELEATRALRAADVLHLVDEVDAGAFADPPRVKSEAWSEADAAEAARTHPEKPLRLTAARFGRDVETDTETTVCVLVHVPWCRFSQELLPVYEEVAAAYQTTRNIVVATLDAARNDLPGSVAGAIKGYPSILVYTRSMKRRGVVSPFVYDGNRSSADISAFILAHNELVDSYHADDSDGGKASVLHAHLSTDVPGGRRGGSDDGLLQFLAKVVTAMQLPITLPGDVSTTVLQCLLWAAVYIPGAVALLYGAYAKLYREPRLRKRYTAAVEEYVRAHKPSLLPALPKLLSQYRGNEKVLHERMLVWYGEETPAGSPSSSSPAAAAASVEPATEETAKAAKKKDAAHPVAAAAPAAETATPKKKKGRPSGKPKEE